VHHQNHELPYPRDFEDDSDADDSDDKWILLEMSFADRYPGSSSSFHPAKSKNNTTFSWNRLESNDVPRCKY
jgi:hypothetical protein